MWFSDQEGDLVSHLNVLHISLAPSFSRQLNWTPLCEETLYWGRIYHTLSSPSVTVVTRRGSTGGGATTVFVG